jgi:hypothetical protein
MDRSTATPPVALLEANQRLLALRERLGIVASKPVASRRADDVAEVGQDSAADPGAVRPLPLPPAHLGWGSERLTAVLRRAAQNSAGEQAEPPPTNLIAAPAPICANLPEPGGAPDTVKLYPSIALGMLRQQKTASGRLWLLLRALDGDGRGAFRIDSIAKQLTNPTSSSHLCGRRQLRNLLREGDGLYWQRDEEYLWLRSAAKVAYGLGVTRLTGQPVALPVATLLAGVGAFRAHLYAAFHASRTPESGPAMPIARETMKRLSGVGRSSQRSYERRAGVAAQSNFAVGEVTTKEAQEERACQKGQALFELKDYRGQQGPQGRSYLAWQLPNSYKGQGRHCPKGRQKRINRELKDLVMKGMPGNVAETSETRLAEKVYYPNGSLAAKAYGRDPEKERYWRRPLVGGGTAVWQRVGG